ncbi:cellulase family glycosylhydrolase [Lachnospiraceae bacterium 46-61]
MNKISHFIWHTIILLMLPTKVNAAEPLPNKVPIFINGNIVGLESYNIDGYTYFRLRDIAEQVGFSVIWNEKNQQIEITSNTSDVKENIPISPWEYQKMLGKGIDVDWSKTNKGIEFYNKKAVKDFKEAGVSHVRIRVSKDANEELFQHLDTQINDCLEYGLIPVLAYQADDLKNNPNENNIQKTIQWWKTVAEHYQQYSSLLSFDLVIEVTDELNKQPSILNDLYEQTVKAIRKTNPYRIVMISPRLRSDPVYLSELKIPSQHNGYIMAEWHFYASGPSKTNERKIWTTGTLEEKKLIQDKIDFALAWQESTNIPTWVGAWMAGNYNDENDYSIVEQIKFAKFVVERLEFANIPFAVNADTKFYQRETGLWIEEMYPLFEEIFKN